jgi:hypothetical protein
MKEEPKNEMDLLLRRLGRRDGATVPDADHLDADELNAYAENALPAAARARYTSHMAECSRCRDLVVQLSSAAGVVAATETANVSRASAWRTFLASLFTPMVLRYAAPALGLIVIAAIGFVVLRNNPAGRSITQVTQNEQRSTKPVPAASDGQLFSYSSPAGSAASPEALNDKQVANRNDKEEANKKSPASPPPPNAAPVVSSVEADVSKDKAAQPKPEQQTTAANEPPPAPKEDSTATAEVRHKYAEAEASKKEVREMPATASAPAAQRGVRAEEQKDRKDNDFARAPKATDEIRVGVQSAGKVKRDDSLSANTRSVAGRRFQKKGGVWIDTGYDSSQDVMTVARGSEGYRSLVADEPAIKTIADELDGEIIVVWKGHTYRIR